MDGRWKKLLHPRRQRPETAISGGPQGETTKGDHERATDSGSGRPPQGETTGEDHEQATDSKQKRQDNETRERLLGKAFYHIPTG